MEKGFFVEGLRPGGGGDRVGTFFVPFAPCGWRSNAILRFKKMVGTLVYIYLTYDTLLTFDARISADGHVLVQQTIPFSAFDAIWYLDQSDNNYYLLLVNKGHVQLLMSVKTAKRIATVARFDQLLGNVLPDDSCPDKAEIRKLLTIKHQRMNFQPRLFPGHEGWNTATSLMPMIYRPDKAGCRLCPAFLSETPAVAVLVLQGIPDQPWMEETHQGHRRQPRRARKKF